MKTKVQNCGKFVVPNQKNSKTVKLNSTNGVHSFLHLSMGFLNSFKLCRCVDPTELGTHLSSVACPACPQGGFLLPGHVRVEQEKLEEEEQARLEQEEQERRNQEAQVELDKKKSEALAQKAEESDDDDFLDDICLHPSMFKKKEPEVSEEEVQAAGEKYRKAKEEEAQVKKQNDKWFTTMAGKDGEGEAPEEEDDGKFSFYKVPWHCTACGMNVSGDQVI